MKRFAILLFTIALAGQGFSQTNDLKYGARFALGQSMFNNDLKGTQQGRIAFNIGLATYLQLTQHFAASVDLHLCSKGTRINGSDTISGTFGSKSTADYLRTFRLFYAEIPILARYTYAIKENLNLNLFAGPSINFAVISATDSKDGGNGSFSNRDINNIKTVEYCALTGLSFNVINSDKHQYFLDFRYSIPLSTAAVIDNSNIGIYYFAIGIGYLY